MPPSGCSANYEDMTEEDAKLVAEWMRHASIEPWKIRIWRRKSVGRDGTLSKFDLRIASSLEFPKSSHVRKGGFGILQTLMEASSQDAEWNDSRNLNVGKNFLERGFGGDDEDEALLLLNREKIGAFGLPAISELVIRLQVYRSTADVKSGRQFLRVHNISQRHADLSRALVANKITRPLMVQMNTRLENADGRTRLSMEEYERPTPEGIIKSYVARFENWDWGS